MAWRLDKVHKLLPLPLTPGAVAVFNYNIGSIQQ
jgi:hypothetical protein